MKDARNKEYVLRKKPPGALLESAHAIEREYRIMNTLANTAIPVPHCYCLCEDASVLGTPFFVMDFVEGRILRDASLPEMTPAHRTQIYQQMNEILCTLHCEWPPARYGVSHLLAVL